jgi:hypothetical protein
VRAGRRDGVPRRSLHDSGDAELTRRCRLDGARAVRPVLGDVARRRVTERATVATTGGSPWPREWSWRP